MAAVDLRASKTGYLTLDQAAAINASISSGTPISTGRRTAVPSAEIRTFPSAPSTRLLDGVAIWSDSLATGGYVDSCYHATARECGLTADECVLLARNSIEATFAAPEEKAALVAKLRAYCEAFSA